MKNLLLAFVLCAALVAPSGASAGTFKSGETYDLGTDTSVDDNLYAAGATLSLGGAMRQDAYAAGGQVTVTGPIEEDLVVAGGTLTLLGPVVGDLRAAGGNVTVGGAIGGELLAAGGNVAMLPAAAVAGDATLAGGVLAVKGTIKGDLAVYGGDVRIDGVVEGDVRSMAETLTLGSGAVIKGKLHHEGPAEAVLESGAVVEGERTYARREFSSKAMRDRDEAAKAFGKALAGALFAIALGKFLAHLLASVLATVLFPGRSAVVVGRVAANFGTDLLTGFLAVVAAPVVFMLLFVSLVGWYVACLLAVALALACMIGSLYSPVIVGAMARKALAKAPALAADWKSALLGAVLLAVLAFIPVLGWIACGVFFLAALGGVLRLAYDGLMARR